MGKLKRLVRKSWFRWTAGSIAALVLWFVASELYGEWKWNRYIGDARKRGVRIYIEEFLPKEPIPDEENFAAMPMWRQAYADGKGYTEMPTTIYVMRTRKSGGMDRIDLSAARKEMLRLKFIAPNDQGSDAEVVLRGLAGFEPFFAQIHEGAKRPKSDYAVDWSAGIFADLDHLSRALRLTRVLELKGIAHLGNGNPAGAMEVVRDLESLGRSLNSEPTWNSYSVGSLVREVALNLIYSGLNPPKWSDAELSAIQALLAGRNEIALAKSALESEHAPLNTTIAAEIHERDVMQLTGKFGLWTSTPGIYVRIQSLSTRWWRENQIWINRAIDEQASLLDGTAETWNSVKRRAFDPTKLTGFFEKGDLYLAILLAGSLDYLGRQAAFAHATGRMAELACALERFKRARGEYPAKLGELVPDFIAKLPHEPVTCEPFHYRLDAADGYLLYSVGADGKDDGGSTGDFRQPNPGSPDWRWFAPCRD